MCEKLLDYMIVGKDMELPDGTVLTNVKTPVIIDNGGIGNLNTDSNMYKMILIYRMCGTDKWQQLKERIVKTDASGKKIKSEAGATTIAVNVGGTLLTKWVSGSDNTIKAVLGGEATDYREQTPFMDDHLTDDYWVYNGNASLIPNQYSKDSKGTVSSYPRITKTDGSKERIGESDSVIDVLRYLLGAKSSQIIKFSDTVRVLEIQPCNCFQYNTTAKKQELANKLLRTSASCITVDCVTPNALNGMTVDIASEYDLVIIGDNIGSTSDANRLAQSNGKTIYNDRNLNGYIYLAFGDLMKISTYALGYLPDEYLEVPSGKATYSVSDANSRVWTKYLFAELTKNKYYVVHDMKYYYVSSANVKKRSSGKIDNASFYNDHYLGNTRIADNDITDITREKLEDYVKTGNPIVVAESVYTADRTKLYPTSDMYQFANETLGATDTTGRRTNTNVLKTETIGSAVAYLGTKAPRINFVQEDVTYIKRTGSKTTVVVDGVSKQVDQYVEKTEKLPVKPVEPTYSNYTYKKSDGSTKTETDVVDRFSNRTLRYKFNITGQAGKTYLVKLLVDKNNDGVFNDINSGKADDNNEVYYSEKVKLNSRTKTYEINSALADNFVGMLAWRIDIIELDSNGKETVYRVSETGYSAIRNEDIRTLKVLQIAPEKQGKGNYLELSTGDFDDLMNAVEGIVGYDMSVTLISVSDYISQYGGDSGKTKLFGYDMVVLGFKDSYGSKDITNSNGALDNLLAYMDAGKAVLFTHDTVSWRSTPNYKSGYKKGSSYTILEPGKIKDTKVDGMDGSQTTYGDTCFNLTINFRNRVGMDKYGVTLTKEERIAQGKEVPMYAPADSSDTTYRPSYMETDEVREIQGFNNWNTARMNYCFHVTNKYIDDEKANNYYWLAPYGDKTYHTSESGSVMYKTKKVVQLNKGPITMYPYDVGTNVTIAETHGQYFELDMEDEDIVVWYTLDAGSSYYTRTYKDAGNNFYIYSKNNITYSGAGHESIGDTQELKLFVNTIVKAIAGGNSEPVITVTNGAEVTSGTDTYNLVYVNSADTASNYEIDFKAEDADLVSSATVGDNIELVGEFSSAKVYWLKPAISSTAAEEKLIKEYGAVNSAGTVVTAPLKNGIIQELLLGNGHTNLTAAELDAIEKAVEVTKTGANFKIEVMDSKGMKDTVYVQLQVRDLFDMD